MPKAKASRNLDACEASIRRWQTRLVRATNMLTKLERQRRRLLLQDRVGVGISKRPVAKPPVEDVTDIPFSEVPIADRLIPTKPVPAQVTVEDDLSIPPMFRRDKPPVDKRKMPLSGKEALAAIKAARGKRRKAS